MISDFCTVFQYRETYNAHCTLHNTGKHLCSPPQLAITYCLELVWKLQYIQGMLNSGTTLRWAIEVLKYLLESILGLTQKYWLYTEAQKVLSWAGLFQQQKIIVVLETICQVCIDCFGLFALNLSVIDNAYPGTQNLGEDSTSCYQLWPNSSVSCDVRLSVRTK